MKKLTLPSVFLISIVTLSCLIYSCGKKDAAAATNKPKEEGVIGSWWINRIQLKIYYNGTFYKDTIIPQTAKPKNFVQFDASKDFLYCFNSTVINSGTYQFKGADSIISTTPAAIYRWKLLTLTDVLFTVMSTSTNNPSYPGAKVETYQTFIR